MSDEDLIGYLLDALNPAERAAVEGELRAQPERAARLAELRHALAPLEADSEQPAPPADLAERTVARLAAHLAEHEPSRARASSPAVLAEAVRTFAASAANASPLAHPALPRAPRDEPEARAIGGRFRPDLIVACGIGLFAAGLVFSAVGKYRAQSQLAACQGNLRTLHVGLAGYANTHGGRYVQVGTATNPTADSFVQALADAGQLPPGFRARCPAEPVAPARPGPLVTPVTYTYSLGYRAPGGGVLGLSRSDGGDEHDLVPICADLPTAAAAPGDGPLCSHAVGMNVLFAGGHVRHTTSPLVGPNNDDIYRNLFGNVAAGIDRTDVVLGRPGDVP